MTDEEETGPEQEEQETGSLGISGVNPRVFQTLSGDLIPPETRQKIRETKETVEKMESATRIPPETAATLYRVSQFQQDLEQDMAKLRLPVSGFMDTVASINSAIEEFAEQYSKVTEAVQSYIEEVREAVEEQLQLKKPWDYNSDEVDVSPAVEAIAINWTEEFLQELDELNLRDDPYFGPLSERVEDGIEEYEESGKKPYGAIHIFVSAQDALMYWLCWQNPAIEVDEDQTDENGDPIYSKEQREKVLRESYHSFFGVEADNVERFIGKWDAFYDHRNFIMHGDPRAHYDRNIATAAILFFALTLHSVLEEAKKIKEKDEIKPVFPTTAVDEEQEADISNLLDSLTDSSN